MLISRNEKAAFHPSVENNPNVNSKCPIPPLMNRPSNRCQDVRNVLSKHRLGKLHVCAHGSNIDSAELVSILGTCYAPLRVESIFKKDISSILRSSVAEPGLEKQRGIIGSRSSIGRIIERVPEYPRNVRKRMNVLMTMPS
jgi:hypothetical protein